MKRTLIKVKFIISLSLILFLAIGCNTNDGDGATDGDTDSEAPGEVVEQELTFAINADPVGLSPTGISDINSYQSTYQMYENLFERDIDTGEIVPLLATSYETPDDTTWIFELREDVEFHDGNPFNAESVKYTFEKLVDPETGAPGAHYLEFMEGIEVVDEYTVKMTTKEPTADVLPVLALPTLGIISPEADKNQDLMEDPVGTGPFKFESWSHGDRLVMTKNENYWGEPAQLDKITLINVPDTSTALSMLETGEVDLLGNLEVQNVPRIESMQGITLQQEEGSYSYFYTFNMTKEPMNEKDFRQAIAMAIDAKDYVGQLEGTGFYSPSLFGPGVIDYDESFEELGYEYDPDAARKIIEENGYGEQELTLYTASDRDAYRRIAEVIQAQLTEIGLNIKIEMMEWGTFLEETAEGEQDMLVIGSSVSMTGLETMYGFFHSDGIGGNNRSQYSNPELDEIIEEARKTLDDQNRQVIINEAHEKIINDALIVPMYHASNTTAFNESLREVKTLPNGVFKFHGTYKE